MAAAKAKAEALYQTVRCAGCGSGRHALFRSLTPLFANPHISPRPPPWLETQVTEAYPKQSKLLRSFARFREDVCRDEDTARRARARADRMDDEAQARMAKGATAMLRRGHSKPCAEGCGRPTHTRPSPASAAVRRRRRRSAQE